MDTGVVMKFKSFFARLASWSEDKEEGVKGKDRATQDLQEEKNLVDPYLTFSFGGKEVSTDVIYNKSEPEFREVLRIPFMSPSMCERLKLQLMDWDQGSRHDHIGTAFLSLSSISGPGEVDGGFLPQFGPCFINFYGSPREYHQMLDKYDYLNKGIGEGVAYRGRLLVELKTMPTHSGVTRPDRISWAKQDTISFESFKRLSSFTLFACFHEANMVAVTDRPVEFELSIGNKGTKFDESVAHSNTPPCKAIPDGFHYHFLPWSREKPCVWIESQWEDIAFRIEPFNVLNRMRENLENELEELKVSKEDQNGLDHMHAVFKGFIKTCSDHLKYFQDIVPTLSGLRNSLDNEIQNLRINELNCLIEDAKAFYNKPESERKKENVTMEIRNYIRRIKSMAMEPQLSIPDVILWMISGDKRVAYYRIPAHDLLFSNNVDAYGNSEISQGCGKFCGKIIELPLKYPRREGADDHLEIPALVRMELWLGLRRHQQQWINRGGDYGEFRVYAETYENQKRKSKTEWKPADSPSWPNYSDAAGQLKLPKESFAKPDGWQFSGDWNESAMTPLRQPDENLSEFLDEMYEHERRKFPGGDWEPGKPIYTDTYGDETTLSTDPTTGWTIAEPGAVNGGWTVDLNRAVDEEGWEYSPHRTYVDFGPEEKAFHLSRRRRLIRKRIRKPGEQVQKDAPPTDGWEYSRSLHESFHSEEKSTDCLRRRRLLHQIVPSAERTKEGAIKFPIFKILVQGKKGKQSALCVLPRMFVTYKCAMKCQLWVSIYQARGLICQDNTGKNDPYVRVTFVNKCQQTKILPQTICPTWDQTLIFEDVDIYGNPGDLAKYPPNVVMELFDHDKGKHDYLGRCMIKPKVLLRENGLPKRKLLWRKVRRGEQDGGQILVECELFLIEVVNLPALPEKREDVYPIRHELRPVTQKKAIEILNWGVRDLKGNKSLMIPTPSVEFECNQEIIKSGEVIGDMKTCPNFRFPVLKRTILELPENDEYAPPLNILVYDNNWFGKSLLGICEIPSLKTFEVQPVSQSVVDDQLPDADPKKGKETDGKRKGGDKTLEDKEVFDWWSKYHASKDEKAKDRTSSSVDGRATTHTDKYLYREYDMLTIYPDKLENQPEFQGFNDFITTFPLRRGKTKTTKDGDAVVGKFKGAFRVINNPDEDDPVPSMAKMRLPSNNPVNCIVRVYIVRATQLQPKDADGLSDPYVIASLGERTRGQPSEHIAKTLNPIFGRVFEFKAKIPLVKDLKIQVWDYDFPTPDDLIGETEIDLEQRLLSRYHATCGLPKTYFKSGPFEWRDTLTPFQLLAKYCALTGKELTLDKGKPEVIIIDETPEFPDNETPLNPETGDPLQRLALRLLHTKFGFVPEHVETRPLYSRERPHMEQGKLEMWVDIFTEEDEELAKLDPSSIGADRTDGMQLFTIVKGLLSSEEEKQKEEEGELPVDQVKKYPVDQLVKAPIFIDPRQPIKYELRVIIWNTTDVFLDDKTITGEKMSDIFVKAWIEGSTGKKQFTSVHERSLDGNGSFNWRMVFPLEYLSIEKEIVVREKVHRFGRDVKEDTVPPVLKVQIFDKDRFTGSDFIGDRHLNLSRLDRPCVHPNHCGTSKDPTKHNQYIDLFKTERKTGWWACYNETGITGKVEMTLEILDEEDAKANPVGLGQSEPNQNPTLPKPVRPAHSFLWYAHPLKTFRYIIWRNYKGFFIKVLIFCLLVLLIAFFVYNIPGYAAKRVVGA